jgi:hypothetical protein
MLGKNNIARIFAIILINLPPNVNARTITVTLTVADKITPLVSSNSSNYVTISPKGNLIFR